MNESQKLNLLGSYTSLSDDLFLQIIMIKSNSVLNRNVTILPFLHSHCLELSLKALCVKYDIQFKMNHDIKYYYNLLVAKGILQDNLLPSTDDYHKAEKLFISGKLNENNDGYENSNVQLPAPEEFDMVELAFWIKHNPDLKYRTDKENNLISVLEIYYDGLNNHFVKLFSLSRKLYASPESTIKLIANINSYLFSVGFKQMQCDDYINTLNLESV
jgi:hypothetical protein